MVVSIGLFAGRVPRDLEWTDQARGPATPRSPSRNGSACFFPLPPRAAFLAEDKKKPSNAVLRFAPGLTAAGRSLPGPRTAIEAAMVAARQQHGDTMATIGTFTAAENGYTGSVKTLTLNSRRGSSRPRRTTTRRPIFASSQAPLSSLGPRGRRPRGTAIANISRSSSTIRVFLPRSMPRW